MHPGRPLPDGRIQAALDGVVVRQGVHPGGQEQIQLLHRELVEHPLDDGGYRRLVQLQAVGAHTRHVIAGGDVRPDGLCPVGIGVGRVEHHQEGLSQLLELGDHPLLRLQIVLPGDVGNGTVCGDHDTDGGMLRNDLACADLRGLGHGDLIVKPGGGYHAGAVVLQGAHRAGNHIAYAVDEADGEGRPVVHGDLNGLLRDEFGLGGHDGAPGAALGQLIPGPLPAVHVVDIGDDHGLHEAFDKGRFSRPHRPHDADIDIPLGTQGNIFIDLALFHLRFLLRPHEPVVFSTYLWG